MPDRDLSTISAGKTRVRPYPLLAKAHTVQLWHGVSLKAIGFPGIATTPNLTPERAGFLRRGYSGYDAVVSTSPFCTRYAFAKAFAAGEFPITWAFPATTPCCRPPSPDFMLNAGSGPCTTNCGSFAPSGTARRFLSAHLSGTRVRPVLVRGVDLGALSGWPNAHNALIGLLKLHPYLDLSAEILPGHVRMAHCKSDI